MIYAWTPGSRFKPDAQVVGERCERLRKKLKGTLTADAIVDDARNPLSPLHACFEWDDRRAADGFRLDQARNLLRSLVTIVDERAATPIRAFVTVVSREEGDDFPASRRAYTSIVDAMANPAMRQQLLAAALNEIKLWRAKYGQLQELSSIFEAIDQGQDLLRLVS